MGVGQRMLQVRGSGFGNPSSGGSFAGLRIKASVSQILLIRKV